MLTKYYTHFLLNERQGGYSEYSGVVEVKRLLQRDFEDEELQTLLAKNFDLDSDDVTILDWSRLH
jgi:hypothetical protein